MKKFIVDDNFWELFPDMMIGVLIVKNMKTDQTITSQKQESLEKLLEEANQIAKKYVPNEPISQNEIPSIWRKAYRQFPTKKGARCSIENLLKRVLKDKPVGPIAASVDITNAISLKFGFPIGAEDMDKIEGDIHLGALQGGEAFMPIGSDTEDPGLEGEIAYYDQAGVMCRCFNWRDGQRTQITDKTDYEFIAMECIQPERLEDLQQALYELSCLLENHLNANIVTKAIVNQNNRVITIEK